MSKKTLKQSARREKPASNLWMYLGIAFLILVVGVVGFILLNPNPPANNGGFTVEELAAGGYSKGNESAAVTLVEFSDFQCPACGAAYLPLKSLFEQYGDRVRFVYRHFPLLQPHPFALSAAEASECAADQGKFWEMHDALFLSQSAWSSTGKDGIRVVAESIGLEMPAYDACMDSRKFLSKVQSDMQDGTRFGVRATPTFFVNTQKLEGFNSQRLVALIESELQKLDSNSP